MLAIGAKAVPCRPYYSRRHRTVSDTQPRIVKEASASGESLTLYGSWSAAALAHLPHWNALQESLPQPGKATLEASWD